MHYAAPSLATARVAIFYRNFQSTLSHAGLGVNGLHTARVLRRRGIVTDVWGVREPNDIALKLRGAREGAELRAAVASALPSHAIIEAPWVSADNLAALMREFPSVHFVVRAHSQIGFLQVEAGAISLLRDCMHLEDMNLNLSVAANSEQLSNFIRRTYNARCLYLPNLYDLTRAMAPRGTVHTSRTLRIGCFGALRLLKNHSTSAAAAMLIAERRGSDLELYISTNRQENAGSAGIRDSLRNMFAGLPWAKLVECPWADWSHFRATVAAMDLCMQLSCTETFNICTADAVAEGVPSVTSDAVEWVPAHWKASTDNAEQAARIGAYLLSDPHAVAEGTAALSRYVDAGLATWCSYLASNPT